MLLSYPSQCHTVFFHQLKPRILSVSRCTSVEYLKYLLIYFTLGGSIDGNLRMQSVEFYAICNCNDFNINIVHIKQTVFCTAAGVWLQGATQLKWRH